ncbi:7444_t:CDS:2 [Paraglomus occultum]|uniref:7444_t:CDS:1 n=1 Tax=Paraglomus occultum TaxID=144539 RepID=A0A9N9A108_9GLOM|nr:7444_t:CDS:2 [Paraglomus occultum]
MYFSSVTELFAIIERIIVLIDTAKYNREELVCMKMYITEVKQTIRDNSGAMKNEYIPSLMEMLKKWEKFLVQCTKPKMRKLLTILSADEVDRKMHGLFADLDNALNAANLRVTLKNNIRLRVILGITERMDELMDLDDELSALHIDVKAVKGIEAICHGIPLSHETIDKLTIDPVYIYPAHYDQPNDDGPTKVIYLRSVYAAKVKIANAHEDISKYWVQAFISSRLNMDLFLKIYGILLDGGIYYMIVEWPGKGTLYEYLKRHRTIPHNVIVDMNDNVKLANFHRARGIKDITTSIAEETDALRWLCPEKMKDGHLPYSTSADVYSFGMLLWELTSHEVPFSDKSLGEVYTLLKNSDAVKEQDAPRPPIVPGTPEKYAIIMQKCWRQVPGSRPTMQYVLRKLEKLVYNDSFDSASSSITEYDPYAPTYSNVTIQTARRLHVGRHYEQAFEQFKILADKAEPNPEANLYVGRYLIDSRIQFNRGTGESIKDPVVGMSYLEVAEDLGCNEAIQFRAQEKMAAATRIRKQLLSTGDDTGAEIILGRMKTECLDLFRDGAEKGNIRCMKDLADCGAKLGDRQSYIDGQRMLNNVIVNARNFAE